MFAKQTNFLLAYESRENFKNSSLQQDLLFL